MRDSRTGELTHFVSVLPAGGRIGRLESLENLVLIRGPAGLSMGNN